MTGSTNSVSLAQVVIEGYRSCRNTDFSPHPKLSALIGINGAGKTSLLSAIRLLANTPRRYYGRDTEPESSLNETVVTAWFIVDNLRIGYRIRLFLSVTSKNIDEVVAISEEWNFNSITKSKIWRAISPTMLFNSSRSQDLKFANDLDIYERQYFASRNLKRANFSSSEYFDDNVNRNESVIFCVSKIFEFRRGITYYGASQFTDPSRCPSSFEIESDGRLTDTYGNSKVHAKFLHDLYMLRKSNPDLYAVYEQFISKNELGLISRLTWKEVQLSSNVAEVKSGGTFKKVRKYKTLIIPKIQIGQSHITFNQLSEGTFKTLAMVFYVMTDSSSCLLIEEPEVCVHLGLLSRIVNTIKVYSGSKQVIFSTHSDQILDQLEPKNVFVVAMTRTGTTSTNMEAWVGRKGRAALTTYLEESGTLGEYWRAGGLSQ
jgi:AAA15 family ATPase/GTPase